MSKEEAIYIPSQDPTADELKFLGYPIPAAIVEEWEKVK